jgi:carbon monoxide dehydrogenase subunit G
MAVISESVEVSADQQTAWDKVADIDNMGDWNTVHVDFPNGGPGAPETGKTFKEKVTIMGMPGEVDWTIDEVDAPNTLSMKGAGPMGTTMAAKFVVEGNGAGTKITYDTEFGGAALAAMAGPLETASKKAADESLAKLKEQLG